MIKKISIMICALAVFLLWGCKAADTPSYQKKALHFTLDENGKYAGFPSDAQNYTPEQADSDGCYVITEDGSPYREDSYRIWETFIQEAEGGKETCMREVFFLENEVVFTDLFFHEGTYHKFSSDSSNKADRPYRYLRKLTGKLHGQEKEGVQYVLTDSLALTYQDVMWYFLSSDLSDRTNIPFETLDFGIFDSVRILSVRDLPAIAEKGSRLTWKDLENYAGIETGSGLYIKIYPLREDTAYKMIVGGTGTKLLYAYIGNQEDENFRLDLFQDNITDFVNSF